MQIIIGILIGVAVALAGVLTWSFIRTAGGCRCDLSFYEKDKANQPGAAVRRRYKGLGHVFYRLWDTLRYSYPLARVYGFRSIAPGFREKIMLVTARTNSCRH